MPVTVFSQTVSISSSFTHSLCLDSTVDIPFTVTGSFNPGNTFTVQLSDATGSFASPTDLGSATTTTSGFITWTVPSGFTEGVNYRLRVVATNPSYTSAEDSISISHTPANPIAKSNAPICFGDTLKLRTTSDPGSSFLWTGPASFSSTQQNPFIPNADTIQSGVYRVTASLYGCVSRPDTMSAQVIRNIPAVTINPGPYDTICAGTSVTFAATPIKGGTSPSYTWLKNGTTVSTGSGFYITSALANNDTIKVIMGSNAQCANPLTASYKTLMTVRIIPAKPIASSNSPVCATDAISLRASASSSGATYVWSGPSFSSTLQNPTIPSADASKAGMYTVYATLNGCVSPMDTDTVAVVPSVTPNLLLASAPSDTICKGQLLTFTAIPTNGGTAPVYKWYLNGDLVAGATSSVYSNDTLHDGDGIICTMTSSLTCPRPVTVSYSKLITVKEVPVILTILGNTPLCSSDTIRLHVTSSIGSSSYLWTGPKGFSSTSQHPVIAPIDSANSGSYSVTATANGCTSPSKSYNVTVHNNVYPTVAITVNPGKVLFPGGQATFTATATSTGSSPVFQWKKNGFDIPGATGTTFTTSALHSGDGITVSMISSIVCAKPYKAISNNIIMSVPGNVTLSNNLTVAPNPTTGLFIVKGIDTLGTQLSISIYNSVGQKVYAVNTPIVHGLFYQEINLSGMISGVYFLHVKTDTEEEITRITVQH